ncbi:hypothetical protein AK812_SmicGene15023 [Symbiodinium microadriaticum]|uniref:Uncharacterized protein n=1 Tax=Symbiodinium microadriaticum TaxID=2951 RepID=A0A1Q9E407_SYMMI|nr:hypothetical protein AK812_SmicGene15023 [Symbiodinium microadriaticum]
MSLVFVAAERAMVFGLVAEAREKLLEVPSVALLLVVLVPLLVGVALGIVVQKFRAEAQRVRTLQDLLVFLPKVGPKMALFTSAYGECFHEPKTPPQEPEEEYVEVVVEAEPTLENDGQNLSAQKYGQQLVAEGAFG